MSDDGIAALLARPDLRGLLAVLDGDGEETRIVGGAIRNALLGRPVTEVDLASTAVPAVVTARAERAGFKVAPTGIDHGTVTVIVDGTPYEVTTLREDVETHGRHATVRFGRDFRADAERRDFSINALSLSADGTIHDPVGGLADLEARRVVFIGDPAQRIREDYLRILRFFRFHAEYGEGEIDPAGFSAAVRERRGLAQLSRERVRLELLKLLAARRAADVVEAASQAGFLERFTGGVAELGRLRRVKAFELRHGLAPDPIRRLAALSVTTVEDAERLRECLRLSNAEQRRLETYAHLLARARSVEEAFDALAIRRTVAERGVEAVVDLAAAVAGEPRPVFAAEGLDLLERFRSGAEPVPVFPLRGADALARGIPKGPEVGRVLERARAAWLAQGCPPDRATALRLLDGALA
ncbi:MAG TPA: CCA tRNA nucleotidyltransferase [Beijerinckiaceae bacterium]|nr:CCA tRNA nucleotidyltransferase [Beijerinckiaceae bacterium]